MSKEERILQLHQIAKCYVIEGLGAKSFDAIPFTRILNLRQAGSQLKRISSTLERSQVSLS